MSPHLIAICGVIYLFVAADLADSLWALSIRHLLS
jgi:hypothetical protein